MMVRIHRGSEESIHVNGDGSDSSIQFVEIIKRKQPETTRSRKEAMSQRDVVSKQVSQATREAPAPAGGSSEDDEDDTPLSQLIKPRVTRTLRSNANTLAEKRGTRVSSRRRRLVKKLRKSESSESEEGELFRPGQKETTRSRNARVPPRKRPQLGEKNGMRKRSQRTNGPKVKLSDSDSILGSSEDEASNGSTSTESSEFSDVIDDRVKVKRKKPFVLRNGVKKDDESGGGDGVNGSETLDENRDDSADEDLDESGYENAPKRRHDKRCYRCNRVDAELGCRECSHVLHLRCTKNPVLTILPKQRVWKCEDCRTSKLDGTVEEILWRKFPEEHGGEGEVEGSSREEVFHVKMHDRAYIHSPWVPRSIMMEVCAKKLKNFLAKEREGGLNTDTGWTEGIWREWVIVDRVIAHEGDMVLVTWSGLEYDQATWEEESFIREHFPDQLEKYRSTLSWSGGKNIKRRRSAHYRPLAFEPIELASPPFLSDDCELFNYQIEGFNWLRFNWFSKVNVVLGDEMGLGKTIQTIAYISSLHSAGWAGPYMVVCPLSTVDNWYREFKKWAPHLNVISYVGNAQARSVARKYDFYYPKEVLRSKLPEERKRAKCNVIITSFEMIIIDKKQRNGLRSLGPYHSLVIDEGHRLKGGRSKTLFPILEGFDSSHKVLLTGTPLQNNLEELYSLLDFLDPGSIDRNLFEGQLTTEEDVAKLHEILKPRLLLRTKEDVDLTLPPKKEVTLPVKLSKLQKECYQAILSKNYQMLREAKQQRVLQNIFMELRKCCNHPYLVGDVEPTSRDAEETLRFLVSACGKMILLDAMLLRLKERGHRVLIFSQMTRVLDILEDYLNLKDYGFERIDGSVTGALRQRSIDRFNEKGSKKFVFLLSTRAGGLGINLATADTVIIYDSDWNPHMDLQALARAHRIGQQSPVIVYRFVTEQSVEERMIQAAKEKMLLKEVVVNNMKEPLTREALIDIIRHGAESTLKEADQEEDKEENHKVDEEALEKILDRSQIFAGGDDNQESRKTDKKDKGLLGDLTKANTWAKTEKAGSGEVLNAQNEAEKAEEVPAAEFWDSLLKERAEKLAENEQKALGRGKRSRKKVDYRQDTKRRRDEPSGKEQGDELLDRDDEVYVNNNPVSSESTEADFDERQVLHELSPHTAAGRGKQTGAKMPSEHHEPPINLKQLSRTDREVILMHLWKFGVPSLGCDVLHGQVIHKLSGTPTPTLVAEYTRRVLHGLKERETASKCFTDGLPKDFCKSRMKNMVIRINTMALIRAKLAEMLATRCFTIQEISRTAIYSKWTSTSSTWNQRAADARLLAGIHIHGWGAWEEILADNNIRAQSPEKTGDDVIMDIRDRAEALVRALRLEYSHRC